MIAQTEPLPVSAVVASRNRASMLQRTIESLAAQGVQPLEIIVVDASDNPKTQQICEEGVLGLSSQMRWIKSLECGAATQRKQGVAVATQSLIWFLDDDILFEPDCVRRLWSAIESDQQLGGVNAMIVNQRYQMPGAISRFMFTLMHGRAEKTFAGKVIGPAINLLPEDRDDLPDVVPVEWLNTTCTMYRREALPSPPFDSFFHGYSLMEDLALSIRVAERGWKLANVRTARIFHDSQRGEHKSDVAARAQMELINRHYVMTKVLRKRGSLDYLRFAGWEFFQLAALSSSSSGRKQLFPHIAGRLRAVRKIVTG